MLREKIMHPNIGGENLIVLNDGTTAEVDPSVDKIKLSSATVELNSVRCPLIQLIDFGSALRSEDGVKLKERLEAFMLWDIWQHFARVRPEKADVEFIEAQLAQIGAHTKETFRLKQNWGETIESVADEPTWRAHLCKLFGIDRRCPP
jgi:hypothetical protein